MLQNIFQPTIAFLLFCHFTQKSPRINHSEAFIILLQLCKQDMSDQQNLGRIKSIKHNNFSLRLRSGSIVSFLNIWFRLRSTIAIPEP